MHRHDPAAYSVGDPLWLQVPDGWNCYDAHEFQVTNKTPSGQVVVERDGVTIRINARGRIVGEGAYGKRFPITAEKAAELRAGKEVRSAWYRLVTVGSDLEKAARNRDMERLEKSVEAMIEGIARVKSASA